MKKVIFAIVLVISVFSIYLYIRRSRTPQPHVPDVPVQTKLEGKYGCLSHRNSSGPQTMECALGLLTDNGDYALDTSSIPAETTYSIPSGQKISIEGTLVPIEQISSASWGKYDIKGIIKVDILRKL